MNEPTQNDTRQAYEVHGAQLRYRAAQLNAQGLPFDVHPQGGGVYVVVVTQPAGVNPFAYQPAPQRHDTGAILRTVAVVLACAVVGYVAYTVLSGGISTGIGMAATQAAAPLVKPLQQAQDAADAVTGTLDAALRLVGVAVGIVVLWFARKPPAAIVGALAGIVRGIVGLWRRTHA